MGSTPQLGPLDYHNLVYIRTSWAGPRVVNLPKAPSLSGLKEPLRHAGEAVRVMFLAESDGDEDKIVSAGSLTRLPSKSKCLGGMFNRTGDGVPGFDLLQCCDGRNLLEQLGQGGIALGLESAEIRDRLTRAIERYSAV